MPSTSQHCGQPVRALGARPASPFPGAALHQARLPRPGCASSGFAGGKCHTPSVSIRPPRPPGPGVLSSTEAALGAQTPEPASPRENGLSGRTPPGGSRGLGGRLSPSSWQVFCSINNSDDYYDYYVETKVRETVFPHLQETATWEALEGRAGEQHALCPPGPRDHQVSAARSACAVCWLLKPLPPASLCGSVRPAVTAPTFLMGKWRRRGEVIC